MSTTPQRPKETDEDTIATLVVALERVVNSGPLNNGLRDENTMAQARAALAAAKERNGGN